MGLDWVLTGHQYFDPSFLQFQAVTFVDTLVGNHGVHIIDIADLTEAFFAELAGVGQHDGFLHGLHHLGVEVGFHSIGGGQTVIQADAVYAEEKFRAGKIGQHGFGVMPYY